MDITQKVFPCFDQTDLKATFALTVTAPSHWTVLANGLRPRATRATGRTPGRFATTPPFSSYLFTLVGGPWELGDVGRAVRPGARRHAAVRLARPGVAGPRAASATPTSCKRITSACFHHYATIFEPEYPYADYHQVFVPGLNWGALESPGCVVFRDEALTQGTPTELEREWLASTIAHEMAHMWFGDLVTMKWWEDSWLNESFADFMGYDVAGVAAASPTRGPRPRSPASRAATAPTERRSTHPSPRTPTRSSTSTRPSRTST